MLALFQAPYTMLFVVRFREARNPMKSKYPFKRYVPFLAGITSVVAVSINFNNYTFLAIMAVLGLITYGALSFAAKPGRKNGAKTPNTEKRPAPGAH